MAAVTSPSDCAPVADEPCAICHEPLAALPPLVAMKCNHAYHAECLHRWLARSTSCPMCRASISSTEWFASLMQCGGSRWPMVGLRGLERVADDGTRPALAPLVGDAISECLRSPFHACRHRTLMFLLRSPSVAVWSSLAILRTVLEQLESPPERPEEVGREHHPRLAALVIARVPARGPALEDASELHQVLARLIRALRVWAHLESSLAKDADLADTPVVTECLANTVFRLATCPNEDVARFLAGPESRGELLDALRANSCGYAAAKLVAAIDATLDFRPPEAADRDLSVLAAASLRDPHPLARASGAALLARLAVHHPDFLRPLHSLDGLSLFALRANDATSITRRGAGIVFCVLLQRLGLPAGADGASMARAILGLLHRADRFVRLRALDTLVALVKSQPALLRVLRAPASLAALRSVLEFPDPDTHTRAAHLLALWKLADLHEREQERRRAAVAEQGGVLALVLALVVLCVGWLLVVAFGSGGSEEVEDVYF